MRDVSSPNSSGVASGTILTRLWPEAAAGLGRLLIELE